MPPRAPGPLHEGIEVRAPEPPDTIVQSNLRRTFDAMPEASGGATMSSSLHTLLVLAAAAVAVGIAQGAGTQGVDAPYPDMPSIAPIGVRAARHLPVPEQAKGPPVDPAKGHRLQQLGSGLYLITDNVYQSMFLVYETGVVIVDAPPSYANRIVAAIREVTEKPVTHLVYSHSHVDHIAGAKALGGVSTIVAHEETRRLLARASDPNRPLPT